MIDKVQQNRNQYTVFHSDYANLSYHALCFQHSLKYLDQSITQFLMHRIPFDQREEDKNRDFNSYRRHQLQKELNKISTFFFYRAKVFEMLQRNEAAYWSYAKALCVPNLMSEAIEFFDS